MYFSFRAQAGVSELRVITNTVVGAGMRFAVLQFDSIVSVRLSPENVVLDIARTLNPAGAKSIPFWKAGH